MRDYKISADIWTYWVRWSRDCQEWVVIVYRSRERFPQADYFAGDDREDAMNTALAMAQRVWATITEEVCK